jgi:hypothetical protein
MRIRCRENVLMSHSLETALVYLLITRSLHNNGCTRHNMKSRMGLSMNDENEPQKTRRICSEYAAGGRDSR